jgi:uncharacterized protein (TIGR02678 family)
MTGPASAATAAHDAAERREAARALLIHPVLTETGHPETLTLVRRHAAALKSTFATLLGYTLVVESSFARLLKAPLSADAPTRAARRADGQEFTPRTYTYLALLCAGLLAPDVGEQVLISALIEQARADAANAGVTIEDTLAERRQLVTAIGQLLAWGVLTETDGTVSGWGERREEALLSIHRPLLPYLLTRPLHPLASPDQVRGADADGPEQPRRSLRRKLVENPLVRREDLTDAERDALSRERRELTRLLEDHFGLTLEVRAEGTLTYDLDEELTDVAFPGNGTVRQAALLLLDALIDTYRPAAGAEITVGGRAVPGVLAPWAAVEAHLADLAQRNATHWSDQYVTNPDRLRGEVVGLLAAVSLVTVVEDGLALHPAAARYRPEPQRAPAATRAARRLAADSPDPTLFGDPADLTPDPETP